MQVKKICEHYQKHSKAPHRFRFKLQDDIDFNYTIYVNIVQLEEQDMLYIINKATRFKATQLIRKRANSAITNAIFNAFKSAWINTYFSLPNFVVYNYEINFNFKKFRISFRFIRNTPKLVLVKAHDLINKVKRYYYLLRRAYEIVTKKHLKLFNANQLQIIIKAINDIIRLNGLIPTLLVFGAYLRMTELDPPNLIVK